MRSKKAVVINLRYQNVTQVNKFKKCAKLCRWSLNTFLLVAAERYAHEILSSQARSDTTRSCAHNWEQLATAFWKCQNCGEEFTGFRPNDFLPPAPEAE